jgi:hypothetical protein
MSTTLPWNLCVVSHYPELPNCPELNNALLYAETVVWLPTELVELAQGFFNVSSARRSVNFRIEWCKPKEGWTTEELNRRRDSYNEVFKQIHEAGLDVKVPVCCLPHDFVEEAIEIVSGRNPEKERALEPGSTQALICDLLRASRSGSVLQIALNNSKILGQLNERRVVEIRQQLDDSDVHGCIFGSGSEFSLQPVVEWSAHSGAQLLMDQMSRLLLPDVAKLPIPAIAELKAKVQPYLDPARADMLRLSKQLREMVKGNESPNAIAREASNLIATEVEPVVRESARHTAEVMKSRWRKLIGPTLNFLGLCGLGWLNPVMFGKDAAVTGLKLAADAAAAVDKVQPPSQAARLVVEMRQRLGTTS